MKKFALRQVDGKWWLWNPCLNDWGYCLSFREGIKRMDRAIAIERSRRQRQGWV